MKKLLIKTFNLIAFLSIVTITTVAHFRDTEASSDNSFVTGSVDLKIDSECHYWDCDYDLNYTKTEDIKCCPPPCEEKDCGDFGNWDLTDLNGEKFFNFPDLTIGDHGEDTISYHVFDNEAYGCFSIESQIGDDCTNCPNTVTTKSLETTEFELKGGAGNCAENAGYDPQCIEKEDDWEDEETSRTHTTTNGIIEVVFIKAGPVCYEYHQDTTSGCYSVTGIGTDTVVVSENFSKTKCCCKDISHTEYVVCQNPISYLTFFSWHDDGDNVFEPGNPEVEIFGPVKVDEFLDKETYTLADIVTGAIPANSTQYIGVAWCLGEMQINYQTGEITCEEPNIPCLCDEGISGQACLDIEFYTEQARHNTDFSCDNL